MRLKTLSSLLILLIVLFAPSAYAATPDMGGELSVELTTDKEGTRGVAQLGLSFDIGASGAHRARISFGTIASSVSKAELGSANRLWNLGTEITQAYLEHTGSFTERGQRVTTRLGDSPLTLSRNVARIPMFQGIWVSGISLWGIRTDLAHGWNPRTTSSPMDTVSVARLQGNVINSDLTFTALQSKLLENTLLELGLSTSLGQISLDALLLDNGVFNAYRFAASMPLGSWTVSGSLTDWGPFDSPYTDHDSGYLWEEYNGMYAVKEIGLKGQLGHVDVAVDHQTYDDLMVLQRSLRTKAEVPLGSMRLGHQWKYDQDEGTTTSNKLSLSGVANVPNLFRNISWDLAWDMAVEKDALTFSAAYTAPNRINFEWEHKSDSGSKLTVSSKIAF